MKMSNLLSADRVLLNFTADDQHDILAQLVAPMVKHGAVDDAERFIADIQHRETEITTVMDNGVALPHARSNVVRRLALTVGIAAEPGLQFNPGIATESRLFFCLAVPAYAPTAHIPLLQLVAKFARQPDRVEKLLSSRTPSVAARCLINFKG